MSTAHTILIEPAALGARDQRYRVTYAGCTLLESVREPLFDACRALAALGIAGRLEMWRPGKFQYDMAVDIQRGARLTAVETATLGPMFRQWQPFAMVGEEYAFPAVTGRARTAASKFLVGRVQPENRLPAG